ncbi:28S ribosomal protein S7, mitochondrial-like [Argonauta hians]
MANSIFAGIVLKIGKTIISSQVYRNSWSLTPFRGTVWSSRYLPPTISKKELSEELEETDERRFRPIKAARNEESTSILYDPLLAKFTNMVMKSGNKKAASTVIDKMLETIKISQLEQYHQASPEEKSEIVLNPLVIFHEAIENCKPVLHLMKVHKGGVRYNVPVSCPPKRQTFLAMKWMIQNCRDKEWEAKMSKKLSIEVLAAFNFEGRTIHKKQELHRQCEANKAYAHFRW